MIDKTESHRRSILADIAGLVYARGARARRGWYARHPEVRRRLKRPVVSVGNLRVGGSGKTPVVRHLAVLLRQLGESPAILTRGYARRRADDGVVVVSDGLRIRADLDRSGDEPLMLARSLAGVGIFVSADRYLAGVLAERRFGATVHILDDGFQHFPIERDADLLLVSDGDLDGARTLPFGRLREPGDVAAAADAIIWTSTVEAGTSADAIIGTSPAEAGTGADAIIETSSDAGAVADTIIQTWTPEARDAAGAIQTSPFGLGATAREGAPGRAGSGARAGRDLVARDPASAGFQQQKPAFWLRREIGTARLIEEGAAVAPGAAKALMVAGIARPARFRDDLERAGWQLVGERLFGDHERFSQAAISDIARAAASCGAGIVLTTEKDLARLLRFRPLPVPVAWVPLEVTVEPAAAFRDWLVARLGLAGVPERIRAAQAGGAEDVVAGCAPGNAPAAGSPR